MSADPRDPAALDPLHALAAGLCHDARIRIRAGKAWAWSPLDRTLVVDAEDLAWRGALVCAGIVAHEIGHAFISRYESFRYGEDHGRAYGSLVLNALEDPRVEDWIARRYPGAEPWIDAAHASYASDAPPLTHALEAMTGFVREWTQGFEPLASVRPYAREALDRTRDARRRYASGFLPPISLDVAASDALAQRWSTYVRPRLVVQGPPVDPLEQRVQLDALLALRWAEREVFPVMRRLWAVDLALVAAHLASDDALARRATRLVDARDGVRLAMLVRAATSVTHAEIDRVLAAHDPQATAHTRLAERVLLAFCESRHRLGGPALRPIVSTTSESLRARVAVSPVEDDEVAAMLHDVEGLVARLLHPLEAALPLRRRLRFRAGFRSGPRLDRREAMAAEVDTRKVDRIFARPSVPDRRSAAFVLLVDLSGSMRGPKIRAATAAAFLIGEVLDRLRVPFAIHGFQDELVPFCPFHAWAERRRELLQMRDEVAGRRPGGRNRPQFNDDGPCVLGAADLLARHPADDRVLIVLSDGHPEGARSGSRDLVEALRTIERWARPVHAIGVGVGPDTSHVEDYYRHHVAGVSLERLPEVLGQLVGEVLTGRRATQAR